MKRVPYLAAAMLAAAFLAPGPVEGKGSKKAKTKRSVTYAKTWNDAVENAIALNVPIVVHRHGFY